MMSILTISLSLSWVALTQQIEDFTKQNANTTATASAMTTLNPNTTDLIANATQSYPFSTHAPHFHISPWILVLPSILVFIFVIAGWLSYANAFPKTKSGQILVRMKHLVSRTQMETIAYQSVDFNTYPL
ncbi:uncharacterized protein [Amphiura filiformis]|uniref:uncharacterized protein n=1 Tax=Amphiura filiformis TaxID=82378 RepID=UPI003B223742